MTQPHVLVPLLEGFEEIEAITIIGIPFALKDLELAKLALAPVGRTIRDKP